MKRISVFLLLVVSSFLISCGQKSIPQPQSHKEKTDTLMSVINTTDSMDIMSYSVEPRKIIYDENGRLIYLSVESDLVSCYTQKGDNQPQKLFFGHVYGEDGFPIMYIDMETTSSSWVISSQTVMDGLSDFPYTESMLRISTCLSLLMAQQFTLRRTDSKLLNAD